MQQTQIINNPFDVSLNSSRLTLRRINETDNMNMFEYTSNPEVTKYLSWKAHSQIEQTNNFISKTNKEYDNYCDAYTWGVVLNNTNKLIGAVRVFDVSFANKRLELSYIINPKFQGYGYIPEALEQIVFLSFDKLGFIRIQARCMPQNISSEKVITKLGMQLEGVLKNYWIIDKVSVDAKLYSLINPNIF